VEKLSAGGETNRAAGSGTSSGVLADRSHDLGRLMQGQDPEKSQRVMKAMLQMDKLDIARLKQAGEQA